MSTVNIFILVDALGWEYIKDRQFLDDIVKTKQPVKSILGFSSGVIPSILTGEYPQAHKHWSLYYYSPKTSPFRWTKALLWLPKPILRSRLTRKIIEEISKRIMGYTGYFETYLIPVEQLRMFDICEKRNIYAPRGIGKTRSVFDIFVKNSIPYKCFAYPMKDREIFDTTTDSLAKKESGLYFLYLSESDALLHRACKNKQAVNEMVDHYESRIRALYATAQKNYSDVNLYIFSDHGMAAVNEAFNLQEEINSLGLKTPDDYVAFYDSTMARFWFFNELSRTKITRYLADRKYGRLINKTEIPALGINFSNDLYGETIFLMKTGAVINPSFMGNKAPQGMHGFDINSPSMDAVLLSNKPVQLPIHDVKDSFNLMTAGLNKKIKVLYFLNSTVRAGAEEHVLRLIQRIDRDKFDPILICPSELLALLKEDLTPLNIRTYPISIHRWRNIGQINNFLKILKKEKPDVVHSHLFFATRFAAPIAKFAKVPLVIETAHLREAWRKGIKKAYFIDRFFYRYVDRIIAVSNAVRGYLINEKRISPEKIVVIHNGVDLEKFKSVTKVKTNCFKVGVIGRLEPQKGHKYFLEAVSLLNEKFNDVKFSIAGEGSLKNELQEMAHRLNITDKVEFLGFRQDIVNLLNEMDLLVLPSLYEGLPLAALEAGASGRPIIATDVDGSPEVILNGITGILVPPADSRKLHDAIVEAINNTDLQRMGAEARLHIENNFNIKKQTEETTKLYLSLR